MTEEEYDKIAWDPSICNRYSFRGLISKRNNLHNLNFAEAGSSNQLQFRLAKNFFISSHFEQIQKKYKNIIVLWGTTSTARNEFWDLEQKKYHSVFYSNSPWALAKNMVMYSYDHNIAVQELSVEMVFWNMFFQKHNIKNLWFDTFDHHNYNNLSIRNLIFKEKNPRDLLSSLLLEYTSDIDINNNYNDDYDESNWNTSDSSIFKILYKDGVLNPISSHPTKLGHEKIANMIEEEVMNGVQK
jgi:hypothetical protein